MDSISQNLTSYVTFDDLRIGVESQHVVCRILTLWEVRNDYDDISGISMLILDEKMSTIHCFIPAPLADDFLGDMTEGKMFHLVNNSWLTIGREKFRVRSHDHLLGLANTNLALPDIVGKICLVEGPNLHDPTSSEHIILRMMLQPNVIVPLHLWTTTASHFRSLFYLRNEVKPILLVTSVNPRTIAGELYLNATNFTRFFFDSNIKEIAQFSKRFVETELFTITDTAMSARKMETVTITELLQFISKKDHQDAEFVCEAKIVDVLSSHDCNYMTCTQCLHPLKFQWNPQFALQCERGNINLLGDDRFHIALAVHDAHIFATFIIRTQSYTNFQEWDESANDKVGDISDTRLDNIYQTNGGSEDAVRWENGTRGHRKIYPDKARRGVKDNCVQNSGDNVDGTGGIGHYLAEVLA